MYKLSYDDKTVSYTTADEVIHALCILNAHYKNIEAQHMFIQWDSPISLQLGLGDLHDRCVILTLPKDTSEDCKILYNGIPEASQENAIHYKSPTLTFSYLECNVIPFNIAIEEIRYILLHQTPSKTFKWYSS